MKKVIVILLCLFISINFSSVSSVLITNNSGLDTMLDKDFYNRELLYKPCNYHNIKNYILSDFLDADGLIDPIYFKVWRNKEFDASFGGKLAIDENNGHLYVLLVMGDTDGLDGGLGILKYDINSMHLLKSTLFRTYSYEVPSPTDVLFYNDKIYILGTSISDTIPPLIAKFDTNLNLIKKENIDLDFFGPFDLAAGADGIYIGGDYDAGNSFDIALAKYDENLDVIWSRHWDSNSDEKFGGMTIHNEDIYLTGATYDEFVGPWNSLILKYDTEGNLIDQVITEEDNNLIYNIKIDNGKKYLTSMHKTPDDHPNNYYKYTSDIVISAYDYDLSQPPIWTYTFDKATYDRCRSISINGDYLYLCGYIMEMDWDTYVGYTDDFILKCDLNTGTQNFLKSFEESYLPISIESVYNNMFVTGVVEITEEQSLCFVMKSDEELNDGNELYVDPLFINFGTIKKGTTNKMQFMLNNRGSNSIDWNVKDCPVWLKVEPSSGTLTEDDNKVEITITIDTDNLGIEYYYNNIILESNTGNEELEIIVEVEKKKVRSFEIFSNFFQILKQILKF